MALIVVCVVGVVRLRGRRPRFERWLYGIASIALVFAHWDIMVLGAILLLGPMPEGLLGVLALAPVLAGGVWVALSREPSADS